MSILSILKSYFQRPAFDKLILTVGIACFIGGISTLHGDNNAIGAFYFFAVALYMIHTVVTSYLRDVLQLETSVVVPGLRSDQFKAWGLVLVVLFLYPAITIPAAEIPFKSVVPMYLFIVAFTTFAAVIRSKGAVLFVGFYSFLFFTVLLRIPPEKEIWQQFDRANWFGSDWGLPVVLTLASVACLVYCVKSLLSLWRRDTNDLAPESELLRHHDRVGFPLMNLCNRTFKTLNTATTLFKQIRLLQFGLFSPGSIYTTSSIAVAGGLFLMLLFVLHFDPPSVQTAQKLWTVFALLVFYTSAVGLSTDFLQHRNRLAQLWIFSAAKTRSQFVSQIIWCYVYVTLKQLPLIAIVLYIMNFLTTDITGNIWATIWVGVGLQFLVFAIAMFTATEMQAAEAKGWTFGNIFIAIIASTGFLNSTATLSNSAGASIGGVLLGIALPILFLNTTAWKRVEFNFVGPN